MTVEFADPEPNGLATILGDLIRANLEQHPERSSLLRSGSVSVSAYDIGLSATIEMQPGKVLVSNGGVNGSPQVRVRADASTLIELSCVPLRLGMPDILTAKGREILRRILSRRMKVHGLFAHPAMIARLNRLLSVN